MVESVEVECEISIVRTQKYIPYTIKMELGKGIEEIYMTPKRVEVTNHSLLEKTIKEDILFGCKSNIFILTVPYEDRYILSRVKINMSEKDYNSFNRNNKIRVLMASNEQGEE